jgi:hypothetical protein
MKPRTVWIHAVAACALALTTAAPAQGVDEAVQPAGPAAAEVDWLGGPAAVSTPVAQVRYLPLAVERVRAVQAHNAEGGAKALRIGINRHTASDADTGTRTEPALEWAAVAAGRIARLAVTLPDAAGARVGLRLANLPEGAQLRVAGSAMPDLVYLTAAADLRTLLDDGGLFWTDVTDGETQLLELFVPGAAPVPVLRVEAASHLLVAMHTDPDMAKALGDSGSCQIDVACRYSALGQPFINAKNAVARYTVQVPGGTISCSGTLLNDFDTSTFTPWFITAQHCVGSQGEANTVRTFWNFETPTCNVDNSGPNVQVTGGAQLAHVSPQHDSALLRLYSSPPAGTIYAAWSSEPLAVNAEVRAIHHPRGDIKKTSRGTHAGTTASVTIDGVTRINMLRTTWNEATTEPGSSGSGLFVLSNGLWRLRGNLSGGAASCANVGLSEAQGNRDYYASYAEVYPAIRPLLDPGAPVPGPTRDYTGNWYQPSEPGRGLSLNQYGDGTLLGLWFVYDSQGRASWYQLDPAWTGPDLASGRVVRWSGPAWGPAYLGARTFVEVGSFSLSFASSGQAQLTYAVDGVARTVALVRIGS